MGGTAQGRSLQRNYNSGKPSFVGKGLDPFRNMVKRNGARPSPTINIRHMVKRNGARPSPTINIRHMVKRNGARPSPTMNFYFMKTERYKTVTYKTNALIKPIAKPAKTSIYG